MTVLTEAAGRVIASDITSVFDAADAVLLTSARLTSSVLEGTGTSGLHPRAKQRLLESMSSGYGKLLEGRKEMVGAHTQMIVIQRQSNLETVDYGCWGSPDEKDKSFFTSGQASSSPAMRADNAVTS